MVYGTDTLSLPRGFTGFWDKGYTVEQWPTPSGNVYEDEITEHVVSTTEIIPESRSLGGRWVRVGERPR